jgi:hypothetical protein
METPYPGYADEGRIGQARVGVSWHCTKKAEGEIDFNPVSFARTEIHRATDRKYFVDFDFDDADPVDYLPKIQEILPSPDMYRILKTRGGFHLLVILDKIRELKTKWHPSLAGLDKCDVRGSEMLTPVPGCAQGGFVPHFTETACGIRGTV